MSNTNAKFWLYETAEELITAKNHFRYYKDAGRLTVHLPDFQDSETGEMRPGKGVSINLDALSKKPETLERIIDILNGLKQSSIEKESMNHDESGNSDKED